MIYLIDDEKMIGETMKEFLEMQGHDVVFFNNPEVALSNMMTRPDGLKAVICDINMPKLQGTKLLEEWRKIDEYTPFYFYTGHGADYGGQCLKDLSAKYSKLFEKPEINTLLSYFKDNY
jgi:DNA-binding NtrC family response regulator